MDHCQAIGKTFCVSIVINKTSLFYIIADTLKSINPFLSEVFVTKDTSVLTNTNADTSQISPCFHEEADSRMLIHTPYYKGSATL